MIESFNGCDGRAIVASDTAENIGEIKGFVVDPTATRVESVHVSGRGRRAQVIPWSAITSFGVDAVMAELADAAETVAPGRDTEAVKGKVVARGTRVLDTNGFEHGTVDDVMFDPATGNVTGVRTSLGQHDATRLRSLGSYALVVDAD